MAEANPSLVGVAAGMYFALHNVDKICLCGACQYLRMAAGEATDRVQEIIDDRDRGG